jgi:hypothetical protein
MSDLPMSHAQRIYIEPSRRDRRGQLYSVRFGNPDGPTIVEDALDPEHAACRVLQKSGVSGSLEVWDQERPYARMRIRSIAAAARITTRDDNVRGPIAVKYRPLTLRVGPPDNDNLQAGEKVA